MKGCAIDGCARIHYARGYCSMHYSRYLRHGDPSARYPTRPPAGRFSEKVDRSAGASGCWIWTGGRTTYGYGLFSLNGRKIYAHRWALSQSLGRPLSPGCEALHSCDNPPCVNPAHLREGSRQQNVNDAVDRDRHARGTRLPQAVLTEDQVAAVRRRAAAGEARAVLSAEFGIGIGGIQAVISGRTWKHVAVSGVDR